VDVGGNVGGGAGLMIAAAGEKQSKADNEGALRRIAARGGVRA